MKLSHMIKALAAVAAVLFSAGQAQAVILQHEGTFTVTEAQGDFTSLLGEQGSFIYIIDYDAHDPNPNTLEGEIPNAVVGLGFSLAGETFFKSLSETLDISFVPAAGELQLFASIGTVTSTAFGDFEMLFFPNVVDQDFVSHPFLSATADFGLAFANVFHTLSPAISFIGLKGADGFLGGQGSVTSTSQFVPPQVGDPVTNPSDPSDPPQVGDPVTGPPVTTVPVPAALPLMLAALGGLFLTRLRRRGAAQPAA